MSSFPRGYHGWVIATKARGEKPDPNLVNFATRYRFAGQLNRLELLGSTEVTQETYLRALRLSLGYSALEQLESALGTRLLPIKSLDCAAAFRSSEIAGLREYLIAASDVRLRNRLTRLVESASDQNIRPVIEALRHAMFHGGFNPSATGVRNKAGREFLRSLEHALFARMDSLAVETFSQNSLPTN